MCGTSGLNAVERFIVGSVSEAIVRHAPCDVLVVRTEEIPKISNLKLQLLNLENNFLNKVMYVNKGSETIPYVSDLFNMLEIQH